MNHWSYSSGGHEPPVVLKKNGQYRHLDHTELLIGVDPSVRYSDVKITLARGDVIVLFSDGLVEAMNEDEDMFDRSRLISIVTDRIQESSSDIMAEILTSVRVFLKGAPMTDDVTVMVLKRLSE